MEPKMKYQADGRLLVFPGVSRRLACPAATDNGPNVALVAEAIAAFAPLLRPLSVDLLLLAYKGEDQEVVPLQNPSWFIVESVAQSEMQLAPSTQGAVCRSVNVVTPDAITSLIEEALAAEKLGPDAVGTWKEIRVYGTEVRLPTALANRDVLEIAEPGSAFGVRVQHFADGAWVRGAFRGGDLPPIQLTLTGPFLGLKITTYWSLWAPGGSGELDLNAAIDALVARGWVEHK